MAERTTTRAFTGARLAQLAAVLTLALLAIDVVGSRSASAREEITQ